MREHSAAHNASARDFYTSVDGAGARDGRADHSAAAAAPAWPTTAARTADRVPVAALGGASGDPDEPGQIIERLMREELSDPRGPPMLGGRSRSRYLSRGCAQYRAAISPSAREAAVVHPKTDGTTYMTVGSGGRPRYGWAGAVEGDRNFLAGVDTGAAGNGTVVQADPATDTGPSAAQLDFSRSYETIDWSQARYSDYAFIAIDVVPAAPDGTTTMTLRAINEQGVEFDRVVFSREVRSRGSILGER